MIELNNFLIGNWTSSYYNISTIITKAISKLKNNYYFEYFTSFLFTGLVHPTY